MGVAVANGNTIGPPGNPDCRGQPVKTPEIQLATRRGSP
jgi:hypothetical protein